MNKHYFDTKELLKRVSETRYFINPINKHDIEYNALDNTFGYYIIDKEYMYVYASKNTHMIIDLSDHTIVKDKGTIRYIECIVTRYIHTKFIKELSAYREVKNHENIQ